MQKIIEELAAQVDASLAGVTSSESLAAFWQEQERQGPRPDEAAAHRSQGGTPGCR